MPKEKWVKTKNAPLPDWAETIFGLCVAALFIAYSIWLA